MITLYPDQQKLIGDIAKAYQQGYRKIIVQAETGFGKTICFSYIAYNAVQKGKRVLILTDRLELLDGSAEALVKTGLHPYLIHAGNKKLNISHHCYVAMAQTLRRRILQKGYSDWVRSYFDIIIIDEAHKQEFNAFFEGNYFASYAFILGFTGTPKRSGKQRQLQKDYQTIVEGPPTQDLITLKRLAKPIYHYGHGVKASNKLRTTYKSGEEDYVEQDVAKLMSVDQLGANIIEAYNQFANKKIAIVFCAGSKNVIECCKLFNDNGIRSKYMISDPSEEGGKELHKIYNSVYSGGRKEIINQWRRGDFLVLVNNTIYTTGFNFPKIEAVIINRLTKSISLLKQMIGRASRIVEGVKESFHIIDMGDNLERLGLWHSPRDWSLVHYEGEQGVAPVKVCPKCKQLNKIQTKICLMLNPETLELCNFPFEPQAKIKVEKLFQTVDYKEYTIKQVAEMKERMSFYELNKLREQKGYRPNWLINIAMETNRINEYDQFTEENPTWNQ